MNYFDDKRINASLLKCYAGRDFSPRKANYDATTDRNSDSMALGSVVHLALEQFGKMPESVILSEYSEFRSKEAKAWRDEQVAMGKTVMKQADYEAAKAMTSAIWSNCPYDVQQAVRDPDSEREVAIYTDEFKALLDLRTHSRVYDYKTTAATSVSGIVKDAIKYGYHIQAHHYLMVSQAEEFVFIFVSSKAPHEVFVMLPDDEFLEYGAACWKEAYDRYQTWRDVTDFTATTTKLTLPAWAQVVEAEEEDIEF